jgi:hypothetical protein
MATSSNDCAAPFVLQPGPRGIRKQDDGAVNDGGNRYVDQGERDRLRDQRLAVVDEGGQHGDVEQPGFRIEQIGD